MTGHVTRVLVVDDDVAVASVHRGYVESVPGFAVVALAHTGAEAVEAVRALRPDLVLLDIYLPDLSGLEVLRSMRASPGPQPDVIVISAARELETVRDAMVSGVVHYLVKPFSLATLRERLESYAAHRADVLRRSSRPDLEQDDVDRLLQTRHRSLTASPLPKGLSQRTLELVATTLRRAGAELSAAEVAGRCGMARVSARRYLEHLAAIGLADVRPRYGSAGRPENGYRWAG
ncbi:MAG: response regulator [Actinomycetota bacterium]